MAQIDQVLNNMARKGIQHVSITAGQPLRATKDGVEAQGASVDLITLMNMAREIVPPTDRARLADKYDETLSYSNSEGFFSLRITRHKQKFAIEAHLKGLAPARMLAPQGEWNPHLLPALKGHLEIVEAVALSGDGARLASAAGEKVDTWQSATGKHSNTLFSRANIGEVIVVNLGLSRFPAWALEFSPDDSQLVGGITWGYWTWPAHGTKKFHRLQQHAVYSLAFLPDGSDLAFGTGGTSGLSDTGEKTLKTVSTISSVASIAFGTPSLDSPNDPNGILQLVGNLEGRFAVCKWTEKPSGVSSEFAVRALAVSPDGHHLISGDSWHTVRIFDLTRIPARGKLLSNTKMSSGLKQNAIRHFVMPHEVKSVSCASVGNLAVASCREQLIAFDVSSGSVVWKRDGSWGKSLLSRHGDRIFVASGTKILILSAKDGSQAENPFHLPATVSALATSRDGRTLSCGCGDGSLHVWRLW